MLIFFLQNNELILPIFGSYCPLVLPANTTGFKAVLLNLNILKMQPHNPFEMSGFGPVTA